MFISEATIAALAEKHNIKYDVAMFPFIRDVIHEENAFRKATEPLNYKERLAIHEKLDEIIDKLKEKG